ncbi:multicopper oxidase domain-containing protein [Georgenia sp. SYP-B2076]|uniref:multicopper oxidase domain-containing protein n=1 Tax=Georgenia sp. SYP-B2076 TaxID=2495881 RepID=UPI001F0BADD2|nr:multicopper oxidase domain-containing protein [Georgenia sp. SYP-B2076]
MNTGARAADSPDARPADSTDARAAAPDATRPAAPDSTRRTGPAGVRPLRTRTGFRLAFLLPGGVALLFGLDAALGLLGLPQYLAPALGLTGLPDVHGPLMVLGFVGTVIALERAVALGRPWGYAAPAASGLAAVALIAPLPPVAGRVLLVLAQVLLLLVYRQLFARQPAAAVTIQVLGAVMALCSAVLWAGGVPVPDLTPWLAGYLVLTIFGERLELSRLEALSAAATRTALGLAVALLGSAVVTLLAPEAGFTLVGLSLLAIAGWLAAKDVARRTVHATGLPRYIAASLLAGYGWLAVGGAVWALGGAVTAGPGYDAVLHAVMLGYVISMIMAHAPVILPAVLRRPLPYHPVMYAPVALLHASLVFRLAVGDARDLTWAVQLGGTFNIVAVLGFVGVAAWAVLTAPRRPPPRRPGVGRTSPRGPGVGRASPRRPGRRPTRDRSRLVTLPVLSPDKPRLSRRTWHERANAVVVAWFVAAFVVAVAHRWLPGSAWLLTHMMLLGAVGSAILIWSGHFADTLLGRPAPGGQRFMVARLAVYNLGAIGVVVGMSTGRGALVDGGGALVALAALAHGAVILRQRRGALMARFGALSRYYVAAVAALATGAVLGIFLARAATDAATQGQLYVAHVATMLMGFVGLTVLGTLVVLWPTMLRTKMAPGAPLAAGRAMWPLLAGLVVVDLGALTTLRPLVLAGAVAYVAGIAVLVRPMVTIARGKPPRSFATFSAAAALGWFAFCVLTLGVVVAAAPGWADAAGSLGVLRAPFAAGFAGQVLVGALSYLAPVMLGGGPRVVRAVNEEMDRAAAARVVTLNLCLILFLLPLPSLVRVTTSMLGLAALTGFLVLLARAGWARVRTARADDVVAGSLRVGPPPVRRRLGGAWGVGAVALAVVLGVAGDPAAAGLGASAASADVAATGQTTTARVTVEGMRFTPDVIEVPVGNALVIELTNTGTDVHDLVLETGATTGRLSVGETASVDVGVVGRDLDGWCSVAGHRQMGMTLQVVAVGAGDDGGAAAPGGATSGGATSGDGTGTRDATGMAGMGHSGGSGTAGAPAADLLDLQAEPGEGFAARDAALPPAPAATVHEMTLTVGEIQAEVAPGVTQERWTLGGTAPGPTLRGKVGDVFDITLVNDGTIGHSIDFHAGALAPDGPMRTIAPGESLTYRFTATRSGIWMYHCSTMPMSMHIANGMFGAVIIDPPGIPPVDREYVLVQSEMYLGAVGGPADADKIAAEAPDLTVFNGYANQYDHAPLAARVGERVRVWVLDAGPSRGSAFHVVGGQFDTVYTEGAYRLGGPGAGAGGDPTGGAQVLPLVAAQGGFVELTFPEAGSYPFVSHAMVDAERGAHGLFRVTD